MEPIQIPEDFSALDDSQLTNLLTQATEEFTTLRGQSTVTQGDLDRMRSLASGAARIRAEQASRLAAAEEAEAEIGELATQFGIEPTPAEEPAPAVEEPAPEASAAGGEPGTGPEEEPAPEATAAAVRPALNLGAVRQRQPRVLPATRSAAGPRITAAVDVPGFSSGTTMELADLTPGVINRANALKSAHGGVGLVASYHHPFPDELIINDPGSAPEGSTVSLYASQQQRLPKGDLVASGGWCAPSETLYNFLQVACPDMLWDAPEVQLARGGLRYFKTPSLDVAAMTWVHTEADDIAGTDKPCFRIPCPDPVEVRCDAVGICVESGLLTQRHFPELVSFYMNLTMVAHEIRIRRHLLNEVITGADTEAVAMPATFGAVAPVFEAIALQAADMIERHSLCDDIAIEGVFPWWSRNMFLSDLARRNGVSVEEVTTADVQDLFTPLGVRIQWARGISPAVPDDIGGATPATSWPEQVRFLMYPAGQIQIGRGAEVNLGVIHDSVKFTNNDYTAAFSEECVAIVDRSVDTRLVTVPVCPSGETGAQTLMSCPSS